MVETDVEILGIATRERERERERERNSRLFTLAALISGILGIILKQILRLDVRYHSPDLIFSSSSL